MLSVKKIDNIKSLLGTMSVEDVSLITGISYCSLVHQLRMAGASVLRIKNDYAIKVLGELSGKYSYPEMARITGFSLRKIKRYAGLQVVTSKQKRVSK